VILKKKLLIFSPNFDDTKEQPDVLPANFPNLLVNGSSGIAVGMATNIPPHNLIESITAAIAVIKNPEITDRELFKNYSGSRFSHRGNYHRGRWTRFSLYHREGLDSNSL
jgi:DNA gyrase subunit A